MNFPKLLCAFIGLGFILSGCVTTREQMYEQNRQGKTSGIENRTGELEESPRGVQSEDLKKNSTPTSANANEEDAPTPPRAPVAHSSSNVNSPAVPPSPAVAAGTMGSETGSYGIEELRAEMARLNGRVEELEHEKQNQTVASTEEQKKLQAKIEVLEKQVKEKEEPEGPKIPEGKTAFEAGKDAYFAQHFEDAITLLDESLKKSDKGKDAEEATYIHGESNFKLKQYKKAIVDFSKFPEKYPKSSYHPKALLRIAESFEALGMKEDAKAFYSDLLDRFPKTAEGKLAKKRLAKK